MSWLVESVLIFDSSLFYSASFRVFRIKPILSLQFCLFLLSQIIQEIAHSLELLLPWKEFFDKEFSSSFFSSLLIDSFSSSLSIILQYIVFSSVGSYLYSISFLNSLYSSVQKMLCNALWSEILWKSCIISPLCPFSNFVSYFIVCLLHDRIYSIAFYLSSSFLILSSSSSFILPLALLIANLYFSFQVSLFFSSSCFKISLIVALSGIANLFFMQ